MFKYIIAICSALPVFKNAHAQNADTLIYPDETHFKNIQQLTFDGDNAEAYWSYDDKHIIFQRKNEKEELLRQNVYRNNSAKQ